MEFSATAHHATTWDWDGILYCVLLIERLLIRPGVVETPNFYSGFQHLFIVQHFFGPEHISDIFRKESVVWNGVSYLWH